MADKRVTRGRKVAELESEQPVLAQNPNSQTYTYTQSLKIKKIHLTMADKRVTRGRKVAELESEQPVLAQNPNLNEVLVNSEFDAATNSVSRLSIKAEAADQGSQLLNSNDELESKEETAQTKEVDKNAAGMNGRKGKAKKNDEAAKAKKDMRKGTDNDGGEGPSGTQEDEGSVDAENSQSLKIPVSRGKKGRGKTTKDNKKDEHGSEVRKEAGDDAKPAKRVDEGPSKHGRRKECKKIETKKVPVAIRECPSRKAKKNIPMMYEEVDSEDGDIQKAASSGNRRKPKPAAAPSLDDAGDSSHEPWKGRLGYIKSEVYNPHISSSSIINS